MVCVGHKNASIMNNRRTTVMLEICSAMAKLRNMSTFILAAFPPPPSSNSTDEANLASPTNHILLANPKLKVSHQKNEVELLKCHNTAQI